MEYAQADAKVARRAVGPVQNVICRGAREQPEVDRRARVRGHDVGGLGGPFDLINGHGGCHERGEVPAARVGRGDGRGVGIGVSRKRAERLLRDVGLEGAHKVSHNGNELRDGP